MDKARVEVQGLDGAFYEACIKSICGNTLEIVYENNPRLEFVVACDFVRLPPPSSSGKISVGDEVEVRSRVNDLEPFGWWRARIKKIRGKLYLIEYQDKTQEFVTFGSIRPCNKNGFCSADTLVQKYLLEDQKVILQKAEQPRTEAEKKERGCQAAVDDVDTQPAVGAGFTQQSVHETKNNSCSLQESEGQSSPPRSQHKGERTEANVSTEELWETDDERPIWVLKLEPPPPKVKKPKRRRRKGTKDEHQYTMEDEYDAEEIRQTPQGLRLFRRFSGLWVEM